MTEGKNWEIRIFLVLVEMSVYALGKSNHALCSTHIYEIHMVSIHVRATDSYNAAGLAGSNIIILKTRVNVLGMFILPLHSW